MNLKRAYQTLHWLNLDVVLGALLCHRAAAQLPNGHGVFDWPTATVLMAVVFVIYTSDRLIDNLTNKPTTARHLFHQKHHKWLIRSILLLSIGGIIGVFLLPRSVLYWGFLLASITALYLLGVFKAGKKDWFEGLKDVIVPLVYSLGVWGTALVLQPVLTWEMLLLGFAFWLITQQNLLLVAYFESFVVETGHSLPIRWGEDFTRRVLMVLLLMVLFICLSSLVFTTHRYVVRLSLVLLSMAFWQHWICQNRDRFLPNEKYRYLSEATFLLPLLVWD